MQIRFIRSTCVALLWAIALPSEALEPQWQILKPSNTGIPGDYCHTIFIDENDRPWIPGYIPFWEEGGVARWNEDGTWTTISNVDYPLIASPRFNDIVKDPGGIMWIGSDAGLLQLDPEVGAGSLQRFDINNSPMLGNQVRDLDVAPDGTIWMALDTVGGQVAGGLAQYDPQTGTWNTWDTDNGLPWGAEWPGWDWVDHVAVLAGEESYTVWFEGPVGMATYTDGLFTWIPDVSPPPSPMPTGLPSNDPVDELGNIWLSVDPGILARKAPDGEMTVTGYPGGLDTEVSRVYAISGGRAILTTYYADVFMWDGGWTYMGNWGSVNHTYAVAEESNGAIWVGGIGGAARFENGNWQRYRLTNTGMIGYWLETIDFDDLGNVYLNGNAAPGVGGFNIYDGVTWVGVNDANYGLGPPWGLPSDDVQSLAMRANGKLALSPGGIQGLLEWNPEDFTFTYLLSQGYDIVNVEEDGLGRLWAARYGNGGIFRVGEETVSYSASNSPLPAGSISSIVPDASQSGYVWIAAQFGMAYTNGDEWSIYPRELLGLNQDSLGYHITCADVAADGTLWIGSGLGVFHFDPQTSEYTQYGLAGTSLPSDDIHHVEIAPDGSVWIATFDHVWPYPGGLTRFDGEIWQTWTMTDSPLPHNQIEELTSRTTNQEYEMWVGTASEGIAVLTVPLVTPADIDGDGSVNVNDLLLLLAAWGPCADDCPEDLDGNGNIDVEDLLTLLANWS